MKNDDKKIEPKMTSTVGKTTSTTKPSTIDVKKPTNTSSATGGSMGTSGKTPVSGKSTTTVITKSDNGNTTTGSGSTSKPSDNTLKTIKGKESTKSKITTLGTNLLNKSGNKPVEAQESIRSSFVDQTYESTPVKNSSILEPEDFKEQQNNSVIKSNYKSAGDTIKEDTKKEIPFIHHKHSPSVSNEAFLALQSQLVQAPRKKLSIP
jgi:hypothetical protein